jgi:hypothetical protein
MTVSVTYSIIEVPGNTITGEWEPGKPAATFIRSEPITLGPKTTFEQFVENRQRKGLTIKTPEGMQVWIPPHRIERIEEEPRP